MCLLRGLEYFKILNSECCLRSLRPIPARPDTRAAHPVHTSGMEPLNFGLGLERSSLESKPAQLVSLSEQFTVRS